MAVALGDHKLSPAGLRRPSSVSQSERAANRWPAVRRPEQAAHLFARSLAAQINRSLGRPAVGHSVSQPVSQSVGGRNSFVSLATCCAAPVELPSWLATSVGGRQIGILSSTHPHWPASSPTGALQQVPRRLPSQHFSGGHLLATSARRHLSLFLRLSIAIGDALQQKRRPPAEDLQEQGDLLLCLAASVAGEPLQQFQLDLPLAGGALFATQATCCIALFSASQLAPASGSSGGQLLPLSCRPFVGPTWAPPAAGRLFRQQLVALIRITKPMATGRVPYGRPRS